jgi:hypothetical protein
MFSKLIKTTKKSNKEISLLDLTDFVTKLFQFDKTLPILTPSVIEQVQYINDKNIKDVCPILIKYNVNADGIKNIINQYDMVQYNYKYLGLSMFDRITFVSHF